jgi:hypothetical protein
MYIRITLILCTFNDSDCIIETYQSTDVRGMMKTTIKIMKTSKFYFIQLILRYSLHLNGDLVFTHK